MLSTRATLLQCAVKWKSKLTLLEEWHSGGKSSLGFAECHREFTDIREAEWTCDSHLCKPVGHQGTHRPRC